MTTLLVGWDGATWDHLEPLLDAGRLPALEDLIRRGVRARLRSTIPPITPAAWAAVATGDLPGRSGILGFRKLDLSRPSGFDPAFATSLDLGGRTVWEHAARLGHRVAAIGFPMTWPPFPLPGGVLLSGWPRPEGGPWTEPPGFAAIVGPWGPRSADPIEAAALLDRRHGDAAIHCLRERHDPLVAVVFSGLDHLAHSSFGTEALDARAEDLDSRLDALVQAAGPGSNVVLVSDHGFGPAPTLVVHLGRALREAGLLRLSRATGGAVARVARAARDGLPDAVWKALRRRLPGRTRAWGHDHARGYADLDVAATLAVRVPLYEGWDGVQVQVRGREPGGIVDPRDLDLVLARVSDALLGIVDERGERCVMAVERREALWPGGDPRRTPDLAVTLRADCAGGDRMGEGAIVEQRSRPAGAGSHRRDGIVALAGPAVRQGASLIEPGVEDIGLTWLAMAGIPLPPGRDGRALTEALTVELAAPAPTPAAPAPTAIAVDAEALHAQLRALGYLDG